MNFYPLILFLIGPIKICSALMSMQIYYTFVHNKTYHPYKYVDKYILTYYILHFVVSSINIDMIYMYYLDINIKAVVLPGLSVKEAESLFFSKRK